MNKIKGPRTAIKAVRVFSLALTFGHKSPFPHSPYARTPVARQPSISAPNLFAKRLWALPMKSDKSGEIYLRVDEIRRCREKS
jgi:hypothetical protein